MATSSSTSNFQSIFNASLQAYDNKTKNKLLDHPLASATILRLTHAVLTVSKTIQQFDQRRASDERLNLAQPDCECIVRFSDTLGIPPGKVIFASIGVLLLAAKDVNASQDMLVDSFERIGRFFKRLESYTERTPSEE
ncbi:hypothetical protein BGY98DRAFT_1191566 [Russula aff. rugulosa BPL654]|nr:hypothetical protein BGY98DRAFT_1191566 [Russula aff. rugulosa BPL654]